MDSLKVKNFIILVLLIVNAVLLAVVISDRLRGDELWDQSVQGAVALLEENGLPNLAQIFTRNRYRREDNIAISRAYFELLREQGFFNQ